MVSNGRNNSHKIMSDKLLTLNFFNVSRLIAASLFLIALAFPGDNLAQEASPEMPFGRSALDVVDPTFDAQISTTSYNHKAVHTILPLPNGKILVGGRFNSYNGSATGSLVRLNADGRLDSSFINGTVAGGDTTNANAVSILAVQPDGKILVGGVFNLTGETVTRKLVRLNADGSLDASFTFNNSTFNQIRRVLVRPNGKILASGEGIVQLNSNGSFDNSFSAAVNGPIRYIELQNGKLLTLTGSIPGVGELARLNDDGSYDPTFNRRTVDTLSHLFIQPDGKIVGQSQTTPILSRFNADGTSDPTFQQTSLRVYRVALAADGGIVVASGSAGSNPFVVSRLAQNGAADPSFAPFTQLNAQILSLAVQTDGKVLIGDQIGGIVTSAVNNFMRFNPDGTPDAAFVTGTGFQLSTLR